MSTVNYSTAFQKLREFIVGRMRLSHIYQPVMLRTMLASGGSASRDDIARALLNEDRSQRDYYRVIVREMPGRVLSNHGIVRRDGQTYRLADDLQTLSPEERQGLIDLCNQRLAAYLEAREDPWSHRRRSSGYIPGSLRYEVISRAKFRCEACGISAEVRALEVDHIVPRNKGGSDDLFNLQALCYVCNAQKRDRDDTNYSAVVQSYQQRQSGCPFCELPEERIIAANELAVAVWDGFPVTPLHTLIIPKRHVSDYFDLYSPERNAVHALAERCRRDIMQADGLVTGFNLGVNAGETAGQTVFHAHLHLLPRRKGDVADPRGGVRGVIPGRQTY
jgi:diadenosine tetraphosphate (Ap4A) HIT family hydrolase